MTYGYSPYVFFFDFFFFVVFIKLSFGKALSRLDLESNVASFFIATNPNRIATLVAGFILQNLVSLYEFDFLLIEAYQIL